MCTCLMCALRLLVPEKVLSHCLQLITFSESWIVFKCLSSVNFTEKVLSHKEQFDISFSLCIVLIWAHKPELHSNRFSHISHLYSFILPIWSEAKLLDFLFDQIPFTYILSMHVQFQKTLFKVNILFTMFGNTNSLSHRRLPRTVFI